MSHQFVDQDGEPAAPAGTVTVTVTRADGTTITPGAVSGSGTDPRSVVLPAGALVDVDWLTVTWSDNALAVASDLWEIVGGTLATVEAVKATDQSLNDRTAAEIIAARRIVEDTATRILRRSVFERFYTERVDGTGRCSLWVSWPDVLEVVRVRQWTGATSYVDLTPAQLASIPASPSTMLERTDGGVFDCGTQNIEISYRFGMAALPGDLRTALIKSIRYEITQFNSGLPRGLTQFATADGMTSTIAGPGREEWATGDVDVDRVVNGYRYRKVLIA